MYCPKCADKLTEREQHLYCEVGDRYLSQFVAAGLRDCFVDKTRTPKNTPYPFPIGGKWFCPADATRKVEYEGNIVCPVCKLPMTEFIYWLIERHPHKAVREGTADLDASP